MIMLAILPRVGGRTPQNAIPHLGGNEMMDLIVADIAGPRGHRLNVLAVSRTDQTCNIKLAYPAPRWMRKPRQKRLKPSLQIDPPVPVHR